MIEQAWNSLLEKYLAEVQGAGAAPATVKNKRAYCSEYLRFAAEVSGGNPPTKMSPQLMRAFADSLWKRRATRRTVASKVGEVIKWGRWIEANHPEVGIRSLTSVVTEEIVKSSEPRRYR